MTNPVSFHQLADHHNTPAQAANDPHRPRLKSIFVATLCIALLCTALFAYFYREQSRPAYAHAPFALTGVAMPRDIVLNAPPFSSERLAIELEGVTPPTTNRALNAYLLNSTTNTGLRCADLPVINSAINTNCDFPDKNIIGDYGTLTFLQEQAVFSATVPTTALTFLHQALGSTSGTPNNIGYGVGLKTQAKLLADHAGFAKSSADSGDLTAARRHTEHTLNILYGSADPRYGDQDNDGLTTNPGDGHGLLRYRQQLLAALQSAADAGDSTTNIQLRVDQVKVALTNIGDGADDRAWANLLIEKADELLLAADVGTAQTVAAQMAAMAGRIYSGEELNDNGEIEPIPGEGGAQTAWRYTQYAADFLVDGVGYVRFVDTTTSLNNDSLRINLTGLAAPNAGEEYWVYLLDGSNQWFLAGAVAGTGGTVDGTLPSAGRNLATTYRSAWVTVGQKRAEAQLPTQALGYIKAAINRAEGTPNNVGYGVGLATQANILANHAGFLRDAANGNNLTSAKQHAEHVLNVLYGTEDVRYGDHDNDGLATNPGDGFGLLAYREQLLSTLQAAAAATDATDNITTRVAEVEVTLDNLGDGSGPSSESWIAALIERTEAFLATSDLTEAKTLGTQVAAIADRIYRGQELNDNGEIEPITDEGGALTAYRYTQHAADFYPEDLGATNPTATPTVITPTPTATLAPGTPTATPPAGSDNYENNDQCAVAKSIATTGTVQRHNFHQTGDNDWVRFDATAGEDYLIEVNIPEGSPADVAMEMYGTCTGATVEAQDFAFSPGIRLNITAAESGPLHLKLTNNDAGVAGTEVAYELSVRALSGEASTGLLILVAGKIKENDPVQPNIYSVTDAVYQLFVDKGATDEDIYYLSPDLSRTGVDASATAANLRAAITQWVTDKPNTVRSLTLYLMDHGGHDIFYLDKERREWITPADLDGWLDELEAERPNLNINIIYEACESGSFISGEESISKPGRVVIASTDDTNLAWASDNGAIFSDHLLASLDRGESLYTSFRNAQIAAQIAHPKQQAWLDGDGDGVGTDDASQTVAAQRGFSFAGTFPDEVWPPFIAQVDTIEPDEAGKAVLRAQVRDDVDVDRVWAVIYEPSYVAPTEGEELVQEALPTVVLLDQGNDWYGARFDSFRSPGTYRVVFFADDNEGTNARPVSVNVTVGGAQMIYLPMISR